MDVLEIRIRFLAALADAAGMNETKMKVRRGTKVANLMKEIEGRFPGIAEAKKKIPVIVLINGVARSSSYRIEDEAEIALVPPASGG